MSFFFPLISINWDAFANDVLAGSVTTIIGIFATIWVYRHLYHGKKKH